MKTAIEKAIEGGWKPYQTNSTPEEHLYFALHDYDAPSESEICMDKDFWQCLGKAMEWEEPYCTSGCGCEYPYGDGSHEYSCEFKGEEEWKAQWHNFIDHIGDGGTPDDFFNNLINKVI